MDWYTLKGMERVVLDWYILKGMEGVVSGLVHT